MKIVIPMAGRGSRFSALADERPEYRVPKPFILVRGIPMVRWATASYPFLQQFPGDDKPVKFSDLIFVILKEHDDQWHVADQLRALYSPEIKIIVTPEVTRGAAETVSLAREYLDSDEDFISSDSDLYTPLGALWNFLPTKQPDTVGVLSIVPSADLDPAAWSFVVVDENGHAKEIREKDPALHAQGAPGIVGSYYFSSGRQFLREVDAMIAENDMSGMPGKQEFYMSQVHQRFCRQGRRVELVWVPEQWMLGTPAHLDDFLTRYHGPLPAHLAPAS